MPTTIDHERFPEWTEFADAVQNRRPDAGTWCEAWTVRDIVVHQTGNAEELARVLAGHLTGEPVKTRGFEEREAPYRDMNDRRPVGHPDPAHGRTGRRGQGR